MQNNIVLKASVQRLKMIIGRTSSIRRTVPPILMAVVYEAAPQHKPAIGLQRLCQHIGSVRMIAPVGEWARTILRIRFHKKTAKIGNMPIYLGCLLLPPITNLWIERISGRQIAKLDGAGIIDAQVQLDAVSPEHSRYG
ncbi:hypothetical protein D3C78_1509530 [compost metagenome]